MPSFSIVIVCRNEAAVIGRTLESLKGLTDDTVVYDNGSTDDTGAIARSFGVRWVEGPWEGFGKTKGRALALARYDWVLFLDADEGVDPVLKQSLQEWKAPDPTVVYEMAFRNYFMEKPIRFGEWGTDYHIRLFNRKYVQWDEAPVHEQLLLPAGTIKIRMKGFIQHRTLRSVEAYRQKMELYARLGAEKYFQRGKRFGWLNRIFSPTISFLGSYIFKLGFLDGREGYQLARIQSGYTARKYQLLKELQRQKRTLSSE